MNGTYGRVNEFFVGTEGSTWGDGRMKTSKKIEIPSFDENGGPYMQEHIDLLKGIVDGKPLNEVRAVAEATMTAIMCRTAAYTGDLVKWSDLMENQNSGLYNLTMHPTAEDFEKGSVVAPKDEIPPVPGNG